LVSVQVQSRVRYEVYRKMNVVRVELDEVRKYRNQNEYHGVPRASIGEISSVGWGKNIINVLKAFHENNPQINPQVEVYRGDTLCFKVMTLNQWLFPPDRRPEWLKDLNT